MALVEVQTANGPRKVRVCDYCRTVCCQTRFCSGFCARGWGERERINRKYRKESTHVSDSNGRSPGEDRPARIVFVIITDGEENSSKEFTRDRVMSMVKHQTDVYKRQFVFIGANQKAIQSGAGIGVGAANSLSSAANAVGTQALYASASSNLSSYRTGQADNMAWTTKDREAQNKAGAVH